MKSLGFGIRTLESFWVTLEMFLLPLRVLIPYLLIEGLGLGQVYLKKILGLF